MDDLVVAVLVLVDQDHFLSDLYLDRVPLAEQALHLVVVHVGDHAQDLDVFLGQELAYNGVLLIEQEGRLDVVKGLFIELLLLIRLLKVLQPNKIQRLIADVHVLNFTQLKIRYLNLHNLLDIRPLGAVPLDILADDLSELLVNGFSLFLDHLV